MSGFEMKRSLPVIAAMLIPGSGHVLVNRSVRGLIYVFWIISMGYITWMISDKTVPFLLRCTGGLVVWMASIAEVAYVIARKNVARSEIEKQE